MARGEREIKRGGEGKQRGGWYEGGNCWKIGCWEKNRREVREEYDLRKDAGRKV